MTSNREWWEDEILFLQLEVEDAQDERDAADMECEKYRHNMIQAQQKAEHIENQLMSKYSEDNQRLTAKCLTYTDVITEYQRTLEKYMHHTGVKLTTSRLDELKRRVDL